MQKNYSRKTLVKGRTRRRRRWTFWQAVTVAGWILAAVLLYLVACLFILSGPAPIR